MKNMVQAFYVGAKPEKYDNVLNRKELSWRGYGASQMVPEEDAAVYFRYPGVWVGETEFVAREKSRKAASAKVEVRSAAADEVDREEESAKTPDLAPGDDRDLLVQAAILKLNRADAKDYTTQGRPRVDRINEEVGTNVSADEIEAAFKALKAAGKLI